MNKKGISDTNKQLYWTLFIIPAYTIFTLLVIYSINELTTSQTSTSPTLEDYRIQEFILGTDECLASIKNSHPTTGYVNLNKYNDETLKKCLENIKHKPFLMTLYYDDETIDIKSPKYQITRKIITYSRPIILIENEQEKNAFIEIKVSH